MAFDDVPADGSEGAPTPEYPAAEQVTPCRPYKIGEHASALSRMLLNRLLISAVVGGVVSALVPIILLVLVAPLPSNAGLLALVSSTISWPIAFAIAFTVCDYLLVRGRLANALGLLAWAGQTDAAALRALTGIRRATDRTAAARWLADHPAVAGVPRSTAEWRASLQVVVGDLSGARATVRDLRSDTPAEVISAALLDAQVSLASGKRWNGAELREAVAALADGPERAHLAVEAGALEAQAAWTCRGDHLAPLAWARPFAGSRAGGVMLRTYWVPLVAMLLVSSVAIAFLFGSAA
jgi:hypothetical protein